MSSYYTLDHFSACFINLPLFLIFFFFAFFSSSVQFIMSAIKLAILSTLILHFSLKQHLLMLTKLVLAKVLLTLAILIISVLTSCLDISTWTGPSPGLLRPSNFSAILKDKLILFCSFNKTYKSSEAFWRSSQIDPPTSLEALIFKCPIFQSYYQMSNFV